MENSGRGTLIIKCPKKSKCYFFCSLKQTNKKKCYSILKQTHLHAVHGHRGQVVGVLFVPAETEERVVLGVLVDDGAVLEVSQVKHADGSIGSNRGEHVSTTSCTAERDVIHLQRQTAGFN